MVPKSKHRNNSCRLLQESRSRNPRNRSNRSIYNSRRHRVVVLWSRLRTTPFIPRLICTFLRLNNSSSSLEIESQEQRYNSGGCGVSAGQWKLIGAESSPSQTQHVISSLSLCLSVCFLFMMGDTKGDGTQKQTPQQQLSSSPRESFEESSESKQQKHLQQQASSGGGVVVTATGPPPFISAPLLPSSTAGQWKLIGAESSPSQTQPRVAACSSSDTASPRAVLSLPRLRWPRNEQAGRGSAVSSSVQEGEYVSPVWKPYEMLWLARAWRVQYLGGGSDASGSSSRVDVAVQQTRGKTRADKDKEVAEFLNKHGKSSFDEEVFEELSQFMGPRMRASPAMMLEASELCLCPLLSKNFLSVRTKQLMSATNLLGFDTSLVDKKVSIIEEELVFKVSPSIDSSTGSKLKSLAEESHFQLIFYFWFIERPQPPFVEPFIRSMPPMELQDPTEILRGMPSSSSSDVAELGRAFLGICKSHAGGISVSVERDVIEIYHLGEEIDHEEGQLDPSSSIVEKFLWTYMDLPYVLGYYAVGLLPLLADRCLNNLRNVGSYKQFTFSDFERIDLGNGNIVEMTPNTVPRGCKFKPLNCDQLVEALKYVTKALVALHDLSFMHRDLCWDKVLRRIDSENEWFIGGFDEAVSAPQIYPHPVAVVDACGRYPPEMGRGLHGVKVDVWGVGHLVKSCGLTNLPKMLRELQNRCLDQNPEQRPTAADCYHHLLQLQSASSSATY
ncbi:PTI1-like tyrosine-protein kinase [Hibiscus syriacus]|uniref:PTI1-like tyrosine-protein kinase n=1 Tax=Hibiscus syriacus TaxID=106335 RepID=A0A6A2XUQ8_HIBSY|nr:PTI1-like tyrosine-protein kinase [Hibiscus syriacus]